MVRGSMVENKIHDDANITLSCVVRQMIEVFQRSIHGVDIFVVGNVVPEINLRGGITWRNPNRVDAKILQIAESRVDAVEISDAVAIAVGEAARIEFVKDRILPPLMPFGIHSGTLGR